MTPTAPPTTARSLRARVRGVWLRAVRWLDGPFPLVVSRVRRWVVLWRHPDLDLVIDRSAFIGPGFVLRAPFGGRLVIGPYAEFRRGATIELGPGAEVVIGPGVVFTDGALIQISSRLEIGERTALGQRVAIFDGSHDFSDPATHFLDGRLVLRPVSIGRDCAVLSKCTIVASVGDRCVVAAHAMVREDAPDDVLLGGVPARVIRTRGQDPDDDDLGADVAA